MLSPDVNILIYAHRTSDLANRPYQAWVESELIAQPFAISALVAVAFVRIVTNRGLALPTPLETAIATMNNLLAHPNARRIGPGEAHWDIVTNLCRKASITGKTVSDAQHAAVAIEHGCTWVTSDEDFHIFARHGLRWQSLIY